MISLKFQLHTLHCAGKSKGVCPVDWSYPRSSAAKYAVVLRTVVCMDMTGQSARWSREEDLLLYLHLGIMMVHHNEFLFSKKKKDEREIR